MFSIGEFSRISGLSVKALRLYHERGLLVPSVVDDGSGYRYYDHANFERMRIIVRLRDLEFGLNDIAEMLEDAEDQADVVDFFERKREEIAGRMRRDRDVVRHLDEVIKSEKEAAMVGESAFSVEEKDLDTILIAGIRYKGKYSDCGEAIAKIAKAMGRYTCGKPFNLYYDEEFKEDDADIESCVPVSKGKDVDGISVRELAGGRCVSLIHKGPYDNLGHSYEKVMGYVKEHGMTHKPPIREVYLKGPGMIFKGKPENYLTEIQILIDS